MSLVSGPPFHRCKLLLQFLYLHLKLLILCLHCEVCLAVLHEKCTIDYKIEYQAMNTILWTITYCNTMCIHKPVHRKQQGRYHSNVLLDYEWKGKITGDGVVRNKAQCTTMDQSMLSITCHNNAYWYTVYCDVDKFRCFLSLPFKLSWLLVFTSINKIMFCQKSFAVI